MERRQFLTAKRQREIKIVPSPVYTGARVLSGLLPYAGPWSTSEALHLCRRITYGARKADVDTLASLGMEQSVNMLLNVPATAPAPPLKNYTNSTNPADPDVAVAQGVTWVNTNTIDGGIDAARRNGFKSWWMGLIIHQELNIREKMVMFWHNHFATETITVQKAIFCYQHNATLRRNALANYKTLVKEITLDPAMLRYLNGYLNTNTAPDENYARELQELFTVGKGADNASPMYTEADVKAAARVLTGWGINNNTNTYQFFPNRHDITNKTFSSYYNNTVVTGRTGLTAGNLELDDLLAMIFNNSDVALNICRRLYRWFVYYDIDSATEANVIAPLADIFRNNNYEIQPVLSTLLKSEHFYDVLNRGCFIKDPVQVVAGMCREFNVVFPDTADYVNNYNMWLFIQQMAATQQMNIGDPPDVAGWSAFYQRPQFQELWINSDTLPKRNQITDQMAGNGFTRNGKNIRINHIAFALTMPNPGDPNALVADSIKYLLTLPLTQATMNQLKTDILLTGQSTDSYWTGIWNAYVANPGDVANTTLVRTRLATLYQYLMRLSEYQLS